MMAKMRNTLINKAIIKKIAAALGELNEKVVVWLIGSFYHCFFLGGYFPYFREVWKINSKMNNGL